MSKLLRIDEITVLNTSVAVAVNSTTTKLDSVSKYAHQLTITDTTVAAFVFVDADVTVAADTVDETGHGMTTGLKVRLTSSGTLPAGLSLATDYFIIADDADTFSFATTAANATAGTQVNITAAASGGNHTVTPTALSMAVQLEASIDNTTFTLIPNTNNSFTASGSIIEEVVDPAHRYVRSVYTVTAGQATLVDKILTWGE